MEEFAELRTTDAMVLLCIQVKEQLKAEHFRECRDIITLSMGLYPDAPEPHNFYGILLEERGMHTLAMKHFRASADLDPTYMPAIYNMEACGSFYSDDRSLAFDREDCLKKRRKAD